MTGLRPRRIAVIRALHLGDLLVAIPALRSLRAGFPGAEITFIGLPWAETFSDRFAHLIDRFGVLPGYPGVTEHVDPGPLQLFLEKQREYGYDLVIQMHGSGESSNQLALDIGGACTAGFYVGDRPAALTVATPYPSDLPEVERNLRLVRLLGCASHHTTLEFPLGDEERASASALLQRPSDPERPVIGFHVGGKRPTQRWSCRSFAEVADRLAQLYGARIVLTGGSSEVEIVQTIAQTMTSPCLDLAGRTSLGELAGVIEQMSLFVSNDTGPAHLAEAVGTPTIRIFGPGDHLRWGPKDQTIHRVVRRAVPCSPCPHWTCPIDHRCLTRVTPVQVIREADDLLRVGEAA